MPDSGFLQRLKERKLVQWALAYLAGAFVVLQLLDALETALGLSPTTQRGILLLVGAGFLVVLVLAWYHGEKGQQTLSGPEILILTALLLSAGLGLSMLPGGAEDPTRSPTGRIALDGVPSLAILPFENLSQGTPYGFFADGLHGVLLDQLARVSSLSVVGKTSVESYGGTRTPSAQIGAELGVENIMEGTVQVVDDRLRVSLRLVEAASGRAIWGERYDRSLDDVFAIQSDVAQRVVEEIGAALSGVEDRALRTPPTADPRAYRLFLQAEEFRRRPGFTRQNLTEAQRLLDAAIELDGEFALAHASLAHVHGWMSWFRYDPRPSRLEAQRLAAETAIGIDPQLPQAHFALGVHHYVNREWRVALQEYEEALAGAPGSAELWKRIASVHRRLGNWDEAMRAADRAGVLDPRDTDVLWDLMGQTYRTLHRHWDEIEALDRALTIIPDFHFARVERGWAFARWVGQLDTLRAAVEQVPASVEALGITGSPNGHRIELALWTRNSDRLESLVEDSDSFVDRGQDFIYAPGHLYLAWGRELEGDRAAAVEAFESARRQLESFLVRAPGDWRARAALGLAKAGLGDVAGARAEADWLQQSEIYQDDAFDGPLLAEARAKILAQVGDFDPALEEIERLLSGPSWVSVETLRLDPRWDPLRGDPRLQALLREHSKEGADRSGTRAERDPVSR